MDTSSSEAETVHLGLWTNWSRGAVFGSTLTLTQNNANLLIAFVSFFVTYVGTRFWRIGCLVLHFAYSSRAARDGLHHQRQVILRNTSNAEDGLYTFLCLGWVWHRVSRQTWSRIFPVLCFTVMCVVGWTLAAGFSSKISTAVGNEVLLTGSNCGALVDLLHDDGVDMERYYNPYTARQLQSAATYAQQCYDGEAGDSQYCTTYVQKSLNSTFLTNATCPFAKEICQSDNANVIIDTGYLDSHEHFGLNAPERERFQYRRVLQCAPLRAENYTVQLNVSNDRSFTRYMYGAGIGRDWTYQYSNDAVYEVRALNGSGQSFDYDLGARSASFSNGSYDSGSVIPIAELRRPDSDLSLVFVSANKIAYTGPVNDPWYKATTPFPGTAWRPGQENQVNGRLKLYHQDEAASALACATQVQFCLTFPEGRRCSPMTGWTDMIPAAAALSESHSQAMLNRFTWLFYAVFRQHNDIDDIVIVLGSAALLAKLRLTSGSAGQLPNDQWQSEVKHWHDISMTSMQAAFVNTAKGVNDKNLLPYVARPNNTEETLLCHSQKINSTQFASFGVFGLLLTFVLGGLIMLLSYTLEPLIRCIWGRRNNRHHAQLEWSLNETLQLQRLTHEMRGRGTWTRTTEFIPLTKSNEELPSLCFNELEPSTAPDEKHPVRSTTVNSERSHSSPSSTSRNATDKEQV